MCVHDRDVQPLGGPLDVGLRGGAGVDPGVLEGRGRERFFLNLYYF